MIKLKSVRGIINDNVNECFYTTRYSNYSVWDSIWDFITKSVWRYISKIYELSYNSVFLL